MYQRQIKQYLTFCLGKKKAPLCWDLQTSNWCFNLKGMWKKISLRLSLLCSLIYCLSWKKVRHKMEIRLSPAWLLELHFRVVQKLLQRKTYLDHFQVQDWTCALSAVIPVPRLFVVYLYSRPRIKFTHQ